MSVLQPNRIDLLELDEASNTLWLTMVEERRWSEIDPSWKSLQAKFDFYIATSSDPTFTTQPQALGRKLGIRFACSARPDDAARHALALARAGVEHQGLRFEAALLSEGDDPAMETLDIPPGRQG
jgi:hypothetical protein